jgi:hypothetical protein
MLWNNFDFFPPQKFLAWNCYHFCWVKNIIMMSFRHILFWFFCTVQKLHKTGIPIPIDLIHFSETPKNWTAPTMDRLGQFFWSSQKLDGTNDRQTPSLFWKLPKTERHGRWTDSVHFLEAPKNWTEQMMDNSYRPPPFFGNSQKLSCTDDGQTPSIFWKLPKIGRNGRQTDTLPFLEDPKNWTARTMDRLRPFFGSSQKLDGTDDGQTILLFCTDQFSSRFLINFWQ